MIQNLKDKRLLLASNSPRRRELLSQMDLNFEVYVKDGIDESVPEGFKAKNVPEYLAVKKAEAYRSDLKPDDVLITADTVVVLDKVALGKPKSAEQAREMLRMLCGRTHKVITGVAITSTSRQVAFSVKTKVSVRSLSEADIEYYVAKYAPMDKAGSYGIQEWIGIVGIDYIEGSFQNVMGLPTQRLYAELMSF